MHKQFGIKPMHKFKHVYWMFTIRTCYLLDNLHLDTITPTQLLRRGEEREQNRSGEENRKEERGAESEVTRKEKKRGKKTGEERIPTM
jgi:hypothetical protein